MKKGWKITLITLFSLLLLVLVGPFLVPIPPLEDTVPPETLADPDSQFVDINGISVHYKIEGEGEPVFILLHGFGANTFSWREVMGPLSEHGTVIAYDRPAFGLTERPMLWAGDSPYSQESNIQLLSGLMDQLGVNKAVLVGNSAGGTLATAYALAYPERVTALIQVDAAIYQTRPDSPLINWLLNTPQVDHIGPLIARRLGAGSGEDFIQSAWHDPSKLDANPEILDGYRKPLMAENWDRALWEHTKAAQAPNLASQLSQIQAPTLVISGDDDQIVPVENSRRLAADILGAELVIIESCGHLPQEECPQAFLSAVENFMTQLEENK